MNFTFEKIYHFPIKFFSHTGSFFNRLNYFQNREFRRPEMYTLRFLIIFSNAKELINVFDHRLLDSEFNCGINEDLVIHLGVECSYNFVLNSHFQEVCMYL